MSPGRAVRRATVEDAEAIAQIHVGAWQAIYRGDMPDHYLDNLNPADRLPVWRTILSRSDDVTLVAQQAGVLCGFCSLVPSRDADAGPGIGEVAAIYVDPFKWHCGHGRALMLAILDQAHPTYRELTLWVLISNSRARCFYEALGFTLDGGEKQDDRWGDFVLRELRYRRVTGA